jgi:hypothetical protein
MTSGVRLIALQGCVVLLRGKFSAFQFMTFLTTDAMCDYRLPVDIWFIRGSNVQNFNLRQNATQHRANGRRVCYAVPRREQIDNERCPYEAISSLPLRRPSLPTSSHTAMSERSAPRRTHASKSYHHISTTALRLLHPQLKTPPSMSPYAL